jgi:hypothetical protein
MDNRNDWKRVTKPVAPSRSEKYGNERREIRDGNNSSRRQYSNSYNAAGSRRNNADNYGNRMEDPNYNYAQSESSGYDSGYIDLNSAVDSIPGKKKRKRIVRETPVSIPENKPYQKVVLKRKVSRSRCHRPGKKLNPWLPPTLTSCLINPSA